jgi:hypothetical protein
MGFGEAKQKKSVVIVDIDHDAATVRQIEVPVFHRSKAYKETGRII